MKAWRNRCGVLSVQEATQRLAVVVLGLLGNAGIRYPIEAGFFTLSKRKGLPHFQAQDRAIDDFTVERKILIYLVIIAITSL